jgi:glycosyltransferase involved in cell wall biosynthesis
MTIRVIIVATSIAPELGGISRSVPLLAENVAKAGVPVVLLAYGSQPYTQEFERVQAAQKEVYDCQRDLIAALGQHLANAKGCVIVHHAGVWTPLNYRVYREARRYGALIVCSPRSMLDPWALNHRWFKKKLAWWLYAKRMLQHTTAIHVTCELERRNVERLKLGTPTVLVPNGIDFPKERLLPKRGDKEVKRCLFLSRLSKKKGLPDLLNAFATVNHPDWVLDIVGNDEGDEGRNAQKLAKQLGIETRVNFLGFRGGDQKWEAYRNADLFVLPTYSENFGLVIGEAMACALPVITTTAAPWEMLDEIGAGWSIKLGVVSLSRVMQDAFSKNSEDLKKMGCLGQEYVYRMFEWDKVGTEMLEGYRGLV